MSWLKFLGLLFAHIGSLFVAYRQGSEGAAAEVKNQNEETHEELQKRYEAARVAHRNTDTTIKRLQDGNF
jgi:hypothetical protein